MQPVRVRLPYSSWEAVCSVVHHLATGNLPARIDASVFPASLREATIEQVCQSLRRLGLIGNGGTPTPAMRYLLANNTAGWQAVLKQTYKEFFAAGWDRMTPNQFLELLERHGATGTTARRAARFVLQALRHADIPYSDRLDHIAPPDQTPKPPGRAPTLSSTTLVPGVVGANSLTGKLDAGHYHAELQADASDRDLEFLQGLIELRRQWQRRGEGIARTAARETAAS